MTKPKAPTRMPRKKAASTSKAADSKAAKAADMRTAKYGSSIEQAANELFMSTAGQTVNAMPTLDTPETRRLRAQLILEEAREAVEALGFKLEMPDLGEGTADSAKLDLSHLAKELADLHFVTIGAMSAFGFADKPLIQFVTESNLAKIGDDPKFDDAGKLLKPEGYEPPNMVKFVEIQKQLAKTDDPVALYRRLANTYAMPLVNAAFGVLYFTADDADKQG